MAVQHYHGSCQCGAVDFDVEADLDHTVACNCSRCRRLGSVLTFAPRSNFTLNKGGDSVTEYLFNTHHIHHLFCKTCGIQSFSYATGPDGTEMTAINVNCLDDVDPRSLKPVLHDGASA
ncbi:GFA family protein [Martelella endophytica]|uniref:Aldehyde-activating protein n=1 Tax=Martelella endophytica TaxID=1486262 RepID=A0A0D5LK38_MAREN|nr:GFA family protein [Martelella endophytica]AJY44501.1 aldehyde-activating protein [Martelella endophytica]